jgi:hypothetical protein
MPPVSSTLPAGLESAYLWTDLHGEGIPGVLSEQAGAWYYSRNLSPTTDGAVALAPLALVAATAQRHDRGACAVAGIWRLTDRTTSSYSTDQRLAFIDNDAAEGWSTFRPFTAHINRNTRESQLSIHRPRW